MVSPPAAVPPPTAIPQPQGSIAQPPQQNRPSPEIQKRIDSVQFCSAPPVSGGAAHNAPGPATSANARPVETYKQLCDSNIYTLTPPAKTDQPCLPEPPTPASETADSNGPKTERCADSVQFCSVLSESPSASPPPQLWSRQPDESAVDYQLFAAWLQLPVPRPARKAAAAAIGCSVHRLNRLFNRHRWKTRTIAFDNHRASAASRALEALLQQETSTWHERARNFRLQEWLLHEQILTAAMAAVDEFEKHAHRASLQDITRLLDLASILGRRAAGMPIASDPPKLEFPYGYLDAEASLRKIYGSPEEASASPKPAPSPTGLGSSPPSPTGTAEQS